MQCLRVREVEWVTKAAVISTAPVGDALERDMERRLSEAVGVAPLIAPPDRGAGASAAIACTANSVQAESEWLKALEAAVALSDMHSFCEALIAIRKATAAVTMAKAGQRSRTVANTEAMTASKVHLKGRISLEHEGRQLDPSTLLRQRREGQTFTYFAFRRCPRLLRWRSTDFAAKGAATGEDTIQPGEVWLALDGPKKIVPVVVVGAFACVAGALRPETDSTSPMLLKDAESLQLHLFGGRSAASPDGTVAFAASGCDFVRESRQMLLKLATSNCESSGDVDLSGLRTRRTITLSSAAASKLNAAAASSQTAKLWKAISPGKKAAAIGVDPHARRDAELAELRKTQPAIAQAVAAAAARAIARAAAATKAAPPAAVPAPAHQPSAKRKRR